MTTRERTFLLFLMASGIVGAACSASNSDGPTPTPGVGGALQDASKEGGGTAGQAGKAVGGSSGEGGEAGEAGEGGEGGEAGGGQGGSGGDGGTAGSAGTGGEEDSGPPCDKFWTREICPMVGSTPGASVLAEVKGGALWLTETLSPFLCKSNSDPALPIKIHQSDLTGDFEVTIPFEKFTSSAYGAAFHAYVIDTANSKNSAQASLEDSGSGMRLKVTVTINDEPQDDQVNTKNSSGTFTFKRTGGLVTVLAEAGGDKKNITGMLGKADLRVGVGLQGPFDAPDPVASSTVSIPAFTVTGGGGTVVSDTFDCNSIY